MCVLQSKQCVLRLMHSVFFTLNLFHIFSLSNPICLIMREQCSLPYLWGFGVSVCLLYSLPSLLLAFPPSPLRSFHMADSKGDLVC